VAEGATTYVLMLKAPRLGEVKTRLAKEVGDEEAFLIYGRLVGWQLAQLQPLRPRATVEVHFTPADAEMEMRYWIGDQADGFHPQGEGDLGGKLAHAMDGAFRRGASRVIFLGGDCPFATAPLLEQAEAALERHHVVIAPALDGGYYLIGLSSHIARIFEGIDWGSEKVFAQTMAWLKTTPLKEQLLPEARDVDTLADWKAALDGLPELRAMFPEDGART